MHRRLLIITDEMEIGGTQRQIVELARHINRANFEVSLVYFRNDSPYVAELESAGVRVLQVPKRHRIDPGFMLRLARLVKEGEYDIIHAFSFSGEIWGWLANFLAGQACFVSSARSLYDWFSPMQWRIKRFITLNSAAFISNSEAGAEHAALRMGVRRDSVHVVTNGLPCPPLYDEIRQRRQAREDDHFRVAFVGRLVSQKNVSCLLQAFENVHASVPGARLCIVGDGPERAELEAQAATLGIADCVEFAGEQADVSEWLAAADVFVNCSVREGLSNAIMEAMFSGLPVVASNVGGNSELVEHGESGLLFPSGDFETLAAVLVELAGDPEQRARLGESGRVRSRRSHDPQRMASEMERIYERCLLDSSACAVQR